MDTKCPFCSTACMKPWCEYTKESVRMSYQKEAKKTAIYPRTKVFEYLILGLVSEAGEVAGKVKKFMRDGGEFPRTELLSEIGDVIWYVAMLCEECGVDMEQVQVQNLAKLQDRMKRNKIKGDGDNR